MIRKAVDMSQSHPAEHNYLVSHLHCQNILIFKHFDKTQPESEGFYFSSPLSFIMRTFFGLLKKTVSNHNAFVFISNLSLFMLNL